MKLSLIQCVNGKKKGKTENLYLRKQSEIRPKCMSNLPKKSKNQSISQIITTPIDFRTPKQERKVENGNKIG